MKKRRPLFVLSALGWLVLAVHLVGCGAPESVATRPPNFVILFADDLGYGDLEVYGHPANRTPELDRLAREGQRWTDFYSAAPVCTPSRAALLTGRLPVRNGVYGRRIGVYFPDDPGGLPDSETTLAEALTARGYRTAIFGKWHLGDRPEAWPTRHGFDQWHGLPYSNDMDWADMPTFDQGLAMRAAGDTEKLAELSVVYRERYQQPRSEYWNVPLIESRKTVDGFEDSVIERAPDQSYLTRMATERAVEFLGQRSQDQQPFLLYLPYSMPHTPIFRSPDFEGESLGGRYGDVIEELDWSVGAIRQALEDGGLAENTLVIFTSDNGPWLAMRQHGGSAGLLQNGKGTTFEGGMREPALFWWPGTIAPGTVTSELASTLDVLPTLLTLAGIDDPAEATGGVLDGADLSPVLRGTGPSPRDSFPYYRQGELQAFRKGRYKVQFVSAGAYSLPPERSEHDPPLLYDLASDPAEQYDIAAEQPEILAELIAAAEQHRSSLELAEPLLDRRLRDHSGRL